MSSGDIDNHLAPAAELERLISTSETLSTYLKETWLLLPCRTFFIPYGAGISTNGRRIYVSYDVATVANGVDCASALVRHETTEYGLREFCGIGEDYINDPSGHRLANRAEHDRVVELLVTDNAWELYNEVIDEQISNATRVDFSDRPIPADLALYPYEDEIRDKLIDAMMNARSDEEWNKLHGY